VSPEHIAACTGARIDRAERFAPYLSAGMAFYGIDTPQRQAAFLAQVGHESGGLKYVSEIWGPTAAQERYEGRLDLGNVKPGDGSRFRGHGLIQTTGRRNHALVRDRLRQRFHDVPDFELEPEALMDTQWAALSACDYWDMRHLNKLADAGDFEGITKAINGGLNGYEDRCERWEYGKRALGCLA
jgi:putative chitinase